MPVCLSVFDVDARIRSSTCIIRKQQVMKTSTTGSDNDGVAGSAGFSGGGSAVVRYN